MRFDFRVLFFFQIRFQIWRMGSDSQVTGINYPENAFNQRDWVSRNSIMLKCDKLVQSECEMDTWHTWLSSSPN